MENRIFRVIISFHVFKFKYPSFEHLHAYEHVLAFPFKRAANDLVFSVKSCFVLKKSDRLTTREQE